MIKTLKKASVVLLSILLLITIIAGLTLNVSATEEPPSYNFDIWPGNGFVSVSVIGDHTRFIKLIYGGEEVNRSNYTVTGTNSSTVITLKEEYLKTLTNRELYFYAYFSTNELKSFSFGLVDIGTEAEVEYPVIIPGFNLKFVKLTYGDQEVDSSNYTVTKTDSGNTVIIFEEDYLETLTGEHSFSGYFTYEYCAGVLKLNVDVQTTSSIASSTTSPNSNDNPQTGYDSSVASWLARIMVLSVVVFVVLITCRKYRMSL